MNAIYHCIGASVFWFFVAYFAAVGVGGCIVSLIERRVNRGRFRFHKGNWVASW